MFTPRPNPNSNQVLWNDSTVTTFSNAEVAAIDSAQFSDDKPYPYASSATIPSEVSADLIRTTANSVTLAASSRLAFGSWIASGKTLDAASTARAVFRCLGSINLTTDGTIGTLNLLVVPIFGRCNNSTLTSSKAAASNPLSLYAPLPAKIQYSGNKIHGAVDQDVIEYVQSSDTKPLFFGWMLDNSHGATSSVLLSLTAYTQIRRYSNEFNVFSPSHH